MDRTNRTHWHKRFGRHIGALCLYFFKFLVFA
uniref:Uncharacterized protein n=1 Tax=Anopheles funestus TaxID=62324 RepID=A0A182S1F9_ANOFN